MFTVQNNLDGFKLLFQIIKSVAPDLTKAKIGLEATVHYSYNILGFLLDKGLSTYAGLSPSTYQSGKLDNAYAHMEKRGSRYLRYALFNATKYVCYWDASFAAYLAKKMAEGKHYCVAISHTARKLVRLIFALQQTDKPYIPAT